MGSNGGGYNFISMLNCDIPNKIVINMDPVMSLVRWVFGHFPQRQNVIIYPAKEVR